LELRVNGPRGFEFAPEKKDFSGPEISDLGLFVFLEGLA
jgi:hypothetical protein